LAEAERRARGKVRRYCAANGLSRLGTLTYRGEGEHDPLVVRGDISRFFRGLRRGLGGERFPYLWVPELHKTGHGWHVHFAVGQYVARSLIESAWGRGFVHIKLIQGASVGSGVRGESRIAAGYLSKYLGKDLSGAGGLNRYDVAQGFQPRQEPISGRTEGQLIAAASERMGAPPAYVWRSQSLEGLERSSGGVAAMEMKPPTAEEVAAWVERTAREQGVASRVTDRATIEAVEALLREGREPVVVRDAKPG
jgi:hypothetical protein